MDETALYLEHERLVYSLARDFCFIHPHLELEEIQREAVMFALEAIRTYTTKHGARLSTWISRVVHCGLIEKTRGNRWQRFAIQSWPVWNEDVPQNSDFDCRRLLLEISTDAASVIKIALGREFNRYWEDGVENSDFEYPRSVLNQILADLGWTNLQIKKVFKEIRDAI